MQRMFTGTRELARRWLPTLAFLVIVFVASYYWMERRYFLNDEYHAAPLQALVDGTAMRPYQYRVLVPWAVRAAQSIAARAGLGVPTRDLFKVAEIATMFCLLIAYRHYLSFFFHGPVLYVLPFALYLVLPYNYIIGGRGIFAYDLPGVLAFVIGPILIYRRMWGLYYPFFLLATLNRETSCFLAVLLIAAYWDEMSAKELAAHTAAQFLIWIGVKALVGAIYAANPGATFEWHLRANIEDVLSLFYRPKDMIAGALSSMGFLWLVPLVFHRHIPAGFPRRALWVVVPFLAGMMVVGVTIEVRIYGDMVPLVLTPALLVVRRLWAHSAVPQLA